MIVIREKKQSLQEKIEPASQQQFTLLKKQMDADPELRRMLTTPMGEIDQYEWLYADELRAGMFSVKDISLIDALEVFFYKVKKNPLVFSKVGDKFTGFIYYKEVGISIAAMKMASFYDDTKRTNRELASDLMNFIKQELPKHDKIVWKASAFNVKAVGQYNAFLDKEKFIYEVLPETEYIEKYGNEEKVREPRKSMLVYRVTGKN